MRIAKSITLFGVVILVAAILVSIWKWRRSHSSIKATPPALVERTSASSQLTNDAVQVQISADNPLPRAAGLSDSAWNYITKLHQMSISKNRPLEFHGRVLDQNNRPVAGVKITTRHSWFDESWIRKAYPKSPVVNEAGGVPMITETNVLITGPDGSFHLNKGQATSLHILSLENEGYQWDRKSGGETFVYSARFIDDNSNQWPAYMKKNGDFVIRIWKKGETEPLVFVNQSIPIKMPIIEDLRVNFFMQPRGAPDLIIKMPLLFPDDPNRLYDRRILFETVHGEIVETIDVFPYMAPETGYSRSWETKLTPSDPKYEGGGWKKHFFVQLRNGKITGSISVHFDVSSGRFVFSGYLNPTGSRNLEPDPEKLITDPEEIRRLDESTRIK
jgi:hypothetical protein